MSVKVDMLRFPCDRAALLVEPAPEDGDAVEHFAGMADERVLVDGLLRAERFELLPGVVCVVRLEPRVPREERQIEGAHAAALAVALPASHELVPETGRRPILDGPGSRRRDRVALVGVEAQQLAAEEERWVGRHAALAEIRELEPELSRHAHEELEVGGPKVKRTAFDAPFRAAELRIVRAARRPVADADLVREDLLRRAHFLERLGVQDLLELRDEELVREDQELDEEGARLQGGELAALEPGGVGIGDDDRVAQDLRFESLLERS